MDLFTTPKDSRTRFLLLAARISEAINRSQSTMSPDFRRDFAALGDADTLWAFSLLLAAWHLRDDREVQELLRGKNLSPLYDQLGSVSLLAQFVQKVDSARSMTDLAGAGGVFSAAVENLGISLLRLALQSSAFQKARDALGRDFPARLTTELLTAEKPSTTANSRVSQNSDPVRRFSRLDFGARYPERPASDRSLSDERTNNVRALAASGSTPLPSLDSPVAEADADRQQAALEWLGDVGYEPHEIEAIRRRRIKFS